MKKITILLILWSFLLLFHTTTSVKDGVRSSLINFLSKLKNNSTSSALLSGWNSSSDPCLDRWPGVVCDPLKISVRKLYLNSSNLAGELDVGALCNVSPLAASLTVLHLEDNNITGEIPNDIANCKQLAQLAINSNQLAGSLPDSLAMLNNLKNLDISNNMLSGKLPDLPRISGLTLFLAQYNQLTGGIPEFDFSNFKLFNVSYNNFIGPIPDVHGHVPESSFLGNPGLCGDPLPNNCSSPLSETTQGKSKDDSKDQILMFTGYAVLGCVCVAAVIYMLCRKGNKRKQKVEAEPNKVAALDHSINKHSAESSGSKTGFSKSEISVASADQSVVASTSLVILTSPEVNGLKFDDLLKAPAEMLGRGQHGSLYKIILENGINLVVKRIKDWKISDNDFKERMQRLDQVKHANVIPALAFYCSKQEKLLVYEHQQNGSLLKFIHGTHMHQSFDWTSRLNVASSIVEALAFMHQELKQDGIAHGNLKSSNILLNKNMEPCISEYGLRPMNQNQENLLLARVIRTNVADPFKEDVYGFGVILLELLTGNLVQHNGVDLTEWVHSVVREEWTVEVFDKSLISEYACEERLVNVLQIAIKCVDRSPEARPSMSQVAVMINAIREEEERSALAYEP